VVISVTTFDVTVTKVGQMFVGICNIRIWKTCRTATNVTSLCSHQWLYYWCDWLQKYAGAFEQERVGMVELPYLTEERLQKMGIPLGPRLRILQEAQISVCRDKIYVVWVFV